LKILKKTIISDKRLLVEFIGVAG